MDFLEIRGGNKISGEIVISGSKNSALPIITSTILSKKIVHICNIPDVVDIKTLIKLLKMLGATEKFDSNNLEIDTSKINNTVAIYDIVRTMRASILVLGPLLARFGYSKVSLPGGCAIGSRPVDLHLKALEKMGAKIVIKNGYIQASAKSGLNGAKIYFEKKTVTGTENLVMAAALAKGITVLKNCATEPEVIQLCEVIQSGGVQIEGIGTETLKIFGTSGELLNIDEVKVIPDRIEAGTYLCAGAITKSQLTVSSVEPKHLTTILDKFREMGFKLKIEKKVLQYFQMKILNQLIL